MDRLNAKELILPLIPLRELVAFPNVIVPILVGRDKSVNALKASHAQYGSYIFLAAQKNQVSEAPAIEEIYEIGTIAKIEKSVEQNNGSFRLVVQGLKRGQILRYSGSDDFYLVQLSILEDVNESGKDLLELSRNLIALFEEYINLKRVRLPGIMTRLKPSQLADASDIIISIINIPLKIKQTLLEELNSYNRSVRVFNILKKEVLLLRSQRELEPNLKREDGQESAYDDYKKKIAAGRLPEYVKVRADEELERLAAMPPYSAESTVSRYYLDWILAIPWNKFKKENKDIKRAAKILDEDHYGLRKVKERILDYLAVRLLVKKAEGEIICFVGPPGVGKSSLSKSIARALDRKFVRMSLGGVKDEAEIRGHRRTYIGSYPGQIIKGLKKAGSMNPVFLLDEIDKLNSDFRGDPASALLEALDPEQNSEFVDHYLDLEINLSQVFFITTANFSDAIPPALLDRMEVIELPGYTEREKLQIAKFFLLKKQAEKNGFAVDEIQISDDILLKIINDYTREAGVRNLEREIAVIMRKTARTIIEQGKSIKDKKAITIDQPLLRKYLGIPKFSSQKIFLNNEVGVAIGLAWTAAGGDILMVEARMLRGKGELILTGRLGEVMKESSSAAFSYTKLKLFELEMDTEGLKNYDIHLHIPEGAVPKEGPSAGVTLAVSLISLLTGIAVKSDYAMTGEITLRGKILPVGGIKEKIIAAHRYGIKNILIPSENEKDFLEDIPDELKNDIRIFPVHSMDELLDIVLENPIKIKNIQSKVIRPFQEANLQ
ncbi:MAG: endopeptidase La [Candidatus Aminicenantes bacterium]|nr:endopeptidase La [Candidatus Aminicenantes bacterium]